MKKCFTLASTILLCLISFHIYGQTSHWTISQEQALPVPTKWLELPEKYQAFDVAVEAMKQDLYQAPEPYQVVKPVVMLLPMPDGSMEAFAVTRSLTMPEALLQKYPSIRTYQGKGIDRPNLRLRLELSPKGVHGMIMQGKKTAFIEPHSGQLHMAYWADDYRPGAQPHFSCEVEGHDHAANSDPELDLSNRQIGGEILVYRAAIAGEALYTNYHGGVTDALAAIAVVINRINGIFEREMGVQLQLIPNNDLIIYTNAATDPYTEGSNAAMINENQTNLDAVIGNANYDIGHVFSQLLSGSVGLANLNSVCRTGSKARGVSATFAPIGDGFVLPAVAHEMGHQFGATHSFNTNTTLNNCAPNRTGSTAWEPGAGSTLMSYAGACPPHNYTSGADDYYHGGNQAQIINYTRNDLGNSCPVVINTGNQDPVVTVPTGGFAIPLSTPFELVGGGSDADGDSLTYSWEQMDLGPAGDPNLPVGNAPLFRSFPARPEASRIFPQINRIVTNTQIIGEILPDYARDMNFRLTVRDLNGGVSQEDMSFEVAGNAGPFLVTYPNDQVNNPLTGGTYIEVQWDVANTNLIPVNCQTVNVDLSTDGGFTYPISLAQQVPNSGSAWVILPEIDDAQCRVRVQAADNIFFDISNDNFTIETSGQPTVDMVQIDGPASLCPGNETFLTFFTTGLLGFDDSVSLSAPSLVPGMTGIFQPETFVPGDTVVFQLQGETTLAPSTYPITLLASSQDGTVNEVFNYFLEVTPAVFVPQPVALTPIDLAAQSVDDVGFAWEALLEAETYEIEVATEPTFGASQIYTTDGLLTPNAQLPFSLTPFSIYYWRVRGTNACGEGEWGDVEAFQTGSCAETVSPNVPVNIPVFGNPVVVTSTVVVGSTDPIEAIKIVNLTGTHSSINDLEMSITSPAGTTVELFSEICTDFDINFDLNFADGGATTIDCPPTNGQTLAPLQPLSAFQGENPLGIWTLEVRDISNFEGGELQNWGLEICTNGLDRPELITNTGLQTDRWDLETLGTNLLEATDASGAPANLLFTVIQLPQNGGLLLNGTNLAIGDVFSQADVDADLLTYLHNGSLTEADSFRFDLRNQAGGWNGVYTFSIDITKSTSRDERLQGELNVFPNPVGDWLEVQGREVPAGKVNLALYNLQGQLLLQQTETVNNAGLNASLNVQGLSSGIYVLRATTEAGMWVQRVLKD